MLQNVILQYLEAGILNEATDSFYYIVVVICQFKVAWPWLNYALAKKG